jgi:hypothetical protein
VRLINEGNYKITEAYARLCALCTYYKQDSSRFNVSLLTKYIEEEDLSLRKIYAKKFFYNSTAEVPLGDHILPLTDACYEKVDGQTIIFV